jgi:hypothetical protein
MPPIDLPSLLTLPGMTAFVYLVMAAVKNTGVIASQFITLVAMVLGGAAAAAAAAASGADIASAVLLGIVAGAMASGVEQSRQSVAYLTRDRSNDARG